MKRFRYDKEFKAADGQPFTILDPDVLIQREVRDKALADKKTQWPAPTLDCDFAQVIIWFMNHIPFSDEVDASGKVKQPRKLTTEDAGNAYAVIKAFQSAENGYVEMEDSVYTWLMGVVKIDGIEAFKPVATQAIITERLMDLVTEKKS